MKKISVSISDRDYRQYGFNSEELSFNELLDLINIELKKQILDMSIQYSERFGLSDMTMDDISDEVKALRSAKDNS